MRVATAVIGTAIFAVAAALGGGSPAQASDGSTHGCLGADLSTGAQAEGASLGDTFVFIAQSDLLAGGVAGAGFEVNLHRTGQIPDEMFPNSCN
jgi:hypothetical protein